MQFFADSHGHCVRLFGRDCSIRRRHHSVIEFWFSPGPVDVVRRALGGAVVYCVVVVLFLYHSYIVM